MKCLLIIFLLLSGGASADSLDKYRLLLGLQVAIDKVQTEQIVKDINSYESNKCMGENPSMRRQNTCFIVSYVAVIGVSYLIPAKHRKPFIIAANVIQFSYVSSNWAAGWRIEI